MNTYKALREGLTKVLRILTEVSLLIGLLSSCAPRVEPIPTPTPAAQQISPEEAKAREEWRMSMAQKSTPKKGCFTASYPIIEWQEMPCTKTPTYPQPPRHGPLPFIVGDGDSVSALVPTGYISMAIGSFDRVEGVTSESGPIGNTGPSVPNAYTLQLNTNNFPDSACSGAADPAVCSAWQQFVFENDGNIGLIYIQYWLLKYNNNCPVWGGWKQFSFKGETDIYCWKNDDEGGAAMFEKPITELGQLSLTGIVSASQDRIILSKNDIELKSVTTGNVFNTATAWQMAEFNVFGDGGNEEGGSMASFNDGAIIDPRVIVYYGGKEGPICVADGFTGETNNLSFGPSAPAPSTPGPALLFEESSAGGAPSFCAAATSVGDTHLRTFNGLFYDMQASGDFILAQVDPDFVVQTRQVSGSPAWPDASVNKAVAAQLGETKIAICLPERLIIDGEDIKLEDGKPHSLPDSIGILRRGNNYVIKDQNGNSIRAYVYDSWIDVTVGLGRWPAKATGLVANADGDVNKIATRDGYVLTTPLSFDDLYLRFVKSWRAKTSESLLSACGDKEIETGVPKIPFYADDLDPKLAEHTRAVCKEAGVKEGPLLDACTLDVAVIGDDKAAQVFVGAPAPIAVQK